MKTIYKASWFLLAMTFLATVLTGNLNAVSMILFSAAALFLLYVLAIWFSLARVTQRRNIYGEISFDSAK